MASSAKDTVAQIVASGGLGAAFIAIFKKLFAVQKLTLRFVDERVERELKDLRAEVLTLKVENARLVAEVERLKEHLTGE